MTDIELYEVGGCVRDDLLGIPTKDVDYTVVGPSTFEEFRDALERFDFTIFVESAEHFTVRAHFPHGWDFAGRDCSKLTADFVLARKEGAYSDGRRPDEVEVGTLYDDLARRDFTVNAMAKDETGHIIDLFGGMEDLKHKRLTCVGSTQERFTEDALRALRAIRFAVTKAFSLDGDIIDALHSDWLPPLVEKVSAERRREELERSFQCDTLRTLECLEGLPWPMKYAIFSGGLRLAATMKA